MNQGLGEYYIQASVPSPSVNVLCASLTDDELTPMLYTQWPPQQFQGTMPNGTNYPGTYNLSIPSHLSQTKVDDIFKFDSNQVHPVFLKKPPPFNTMFNYSKTWGQEAVFLLATSADNTSSLCSIRVAWTPHCSTEYHSSVSGGSLTSRCDDPENGLAYSKSNSTAPYVNSERFLPFLLFG